MAQLIRDSCVLRFEEYEFLEFFGVDAPLDEVACSYSYELAKDGLRLLFTLFPLDGGVYTSIYRDGIVDPIVVTRLNGCSHYRFVTWRGQRCMEIGRPERPTTEREPPLVWGLRLTLEPHFGQEFIHEIA